MADPLEAYLARRGSAPAADPLASMSKGGDDPLAGYLSARGASLTAEPEAAPAAEGPGKIESALRGLKQGISFGFGDEITGAVESAFSKKTYKQARDEARAADKAAKEANPMTFGLGQIFGGVATSLVPVGAAAKVVGAGAKLGTGIAASAARGAGAGIVTGAGESEAETAKGLVMDAAAGGLTGAAAGAVGGGLSRIFGGPKGVVAGAPARADRNLMADIGDAGTLSKHSTRKELAEQVKRLGAGNEEVGLRKAATIVEDAGLAAHVREPAKLAPLADVAKKDAGQVVGDILTTSGTAPRSQVIRALHVVEQKFRTGGAADEAAADKVARQIDLLKTRWTGAGPDPKIPLTQVNALKSSINEGAFSGADVAPKIAKRAEQEASRAVRRVIEKNVKKNAGDDVAAAYRVANERYGVLVTVAKAANERAQKTPFPPTGLRAIAGDARSAAAAVAAIATGSPLALLASKPATDAMMGAGRVGTRALAQLVRASRAGEPTAQLVERALAAGVPRATIEGVVSRFAPHTGTDAELEAAAAQ